MSYLVSDMGIHEMVSNLTDFSFLISDLQSVVDYESLYPEEQNLLMYTLRIFGELSKSPKMIERNMTNGILPLTLVILQ